MDSEITNYANGADDSDLEVMEHLLRGDPTNLSLLEWIAFLHYTRSNHNRAIDLYRQLIALDSKNEGHYYYLANSYYKVDEVKQALEYWSKVIEISPNSKFAFKARRLYKKHA